VARGETTVRIIPPPGDLFTGFIRFDTLATGSDIDRVAFFLDGKPVLTKTHPPFNVELDLGPFPRLRPLRVEALNESGEVVAADERLLNAGGQRFAVRLREPRRGQTYTRSLRAHAQIEVPEERTLERVEFYLNETLMATLYQAPFVQPIALPSTAEVSYVRAAAYLADGNSTEDLVFINSPDYLEEVDVQFIELFAAVVDRSGRPVNGLARSAFRIVEDGVSQDILRFERVENLPIHVGIMVDNSASMSGVLEETRQAALSFFEQAIEPRDRAAVITFNKFPRLAVKLTSDLALLGGGLAGLTAEGQTALYDSLMFGLYYFTGIKGQRAILLLSDGKDESSRFEFDDTLEYARRAGVTIYTIGLEVNDGTARHNLTQLSGETGGQSYFIRDIGDLRKIYHTIQQELRSQYMIAYQSSNTSGDTAFRTVELKVNRAGVDVKTMRGYYP
jgi:Ca-activated chloride channel family protein